MKKLFSIGAFCALFALVSVNSQAAPMGPVYPAPGGNSFAGNGVNGGSGTAVWNLSNFDPSAFDSLYYGLNQVDYGTLGAGLTGNADPFTSVSVAGQTATFSGSTIWENSANPAIQQNVDTRLVMTVTGLGANPWITDLASIGLDDIALGFLGAVVDNSSGLDFVLSWAIQANLGGGWQAINSVPQHFSNDGQTRTSFATGFYYEVTPVPVPAALPLLASALIGFGFFGWRKKRLVAC